MIRSIMHLSFANLLSAPWSAILTDRHLLHHARCTLSLRWFNQPLLSLPVLHRNLTSTQYPSFSSIYFPTTQLRLLLLLLPLLHDRHRSRGTRMFNVNRASTATSTPRSEPLFALYKVFKSGRVCMGGVSDAVLVAWAGIGSWGRDINTYTPDATLRERDDFR